MKRLKTMTTMLLLAMSAAAQGVVEGVVSDSLCLLLTVVANVGRQAEWNEMNMQALKSTA